MRFHISRHNVCLIGLVALIYSALTVMAAGCALNHVDRSQSHQHHHSEQGSPDQNLLCAWACQATADAAAASGSPPAVTKLMVGLADFTSSRLYLFQRSSTVRSRAPPPIPFVRLG